MGSQTGDCGALKSAVTVPGLQQSLVSVGALMDSHPGVSVLFTKNGVYLVPSAIAERQFFDCPQVGTRAPCGLYHTEVGKVTNAVRSLAEDDFVFRKAKRIKRTDAAHVAQSDGWFTAESPSDTRSSATYIDGNGNVRANAAANDAAATEGATRTTSTSTTDECSRRTRGWR